MLKRQKEPTERAKATVLIVMEEVDEPRLAESVRDEVIGAGESRTVILVENPVLSHGKVDEIHGTLRPNHEVDTV
jgi:hypothetical protein